LLIVLTLRKQAADSTQSMQPKLIAFGVLVAGVPVLQFVLYHAPWAGEQVAHYLEFAFAAVSAAVSFWFTTDSMLVSDRLKLEIMLAPSDVQVVVDGLSRRAVHDHGAPMAAPTYAPPLLPPSLVDAPPQGIPTGDLAVAQCSFTAEVDPNCADPNCAQHGQRDDRLSPPWVQRAV
jgi:hypothetical protein